jgi:hypothetical protein
MLINLWNEALNMETQRIKGIQNLYEEIVKSNSNVYGAQAQKELVHMRDKFLSHPLFSVRGLLREKELEAIVTLCYQQHRKINLEQATPGEIQDFLVSVKLEKSPQSNLIRKAGTLLRDPGVFSSWTTSSVILSKDNFLHIYPWRDASMEEN